MDDSGRQEFPETATEADLESALKENAAGTLALIQVNLECNYTLSELKRADNLLFTKYKIKELGLLYACISAYVCAVPAIICYLFNKDEASHLLNTCLLWSPLLVPFCIGHTWYIHKKRIEILGEALKADGQLLIELSEQSLLVRSPTASNAYAWSNITACLSTSDQYICLHSSGPIIIPKRLLDDPVKAACVELLLRLKIEKYEELN